MNDDFEKAIRERDDLEREDDTSRWAIELLKKRGLLRRTEQSVRTTVRTTAGDDAIVEREDRRSPKE
jgi:hypothetical protein